MNKVEEDTIDPYIFSLLEHATSSDKVLREYNLYQQIKTRKLYGWKRNNDYVACIGIEMTLSNDAEIKHIAVSPNLREQRIGSKMLDYMVNELGIRRLTAETDQDAVGFYRNYGFIVSSIGEKYPGVERFWCEWEKKSK
ncbi:GNAT family N-acetyltransferase [Psychrobacillus sp. FSL K6-2843]|uniref:GNAT family N-acetyltransferase n=1 Tax=Psychrobacillus sp. FSL K6-2843 TaxID=2921549 RepID=UPI003159DDCD